MDPQKPLPGESDPRRAAEPLTPFSAPTRERREPPTAVETLHLLCALIDGTPLRRAHERAVAKLRAYCAAHPIHDPESAPIARAGR